jgi:hypothetical protein
MVIFKVTALKSRETLMKTFVFHDVKFKALTSEWFDSFTKYILKQGYQ